MTEKELAEKALKDIMSEKVTSITECKHFYIVGFKKGYQPLKEENVQLKQSNWELLMKIEKMKNCGNCNGIRDGIRDEKCKQCLKHKDLRYWELAE